MQFSTVRVSSEKRRKYNNRYYKQKKWRKEKNSLIKNFNIEINEIENESIHSELDKLINNSQIVDIDYSNKEELLKADECFVTSSTKEVLPVTKIDNQAIGNGKPGKKTSQLAKIYTNYINEYIKKNGQFY